MIRRGLVTALALAFLALPLWSASLRPNRYEGGRSRDLGDRARRNQSAVAMMFGEFRTSMNDLMLLKTERYMHSGVAYTPHMDEVMLSIENTTAGLNAHQNAVGADGKDHSGCNHAHGSCDHTDPAAGSRAVLKDAGADFRGWIGHLHRRVQPWSEEHAEHTDGLEILPWFRVMTLSDPQAVRGYTMGAWWLKSRDIGQAMAFLDEGIRNNPEAFQLHLMKGEFLIARGREIAGPRMFTDPPAEALSLFEQARARFVRAAELAMAQRPEEPEAGDPAWSDYLEEDTRGVLRMVVLLERQYGDREKAIRLARRYLEFLRGDPVLSRVIQRFEAETAPFVFKPPQSG